MTVNRIFVAAAVTSAASLAGTSLPINAQGALAIGFVRITNGLNGEPSNGDSAGPSISADGRFVTFGSFASNLVPDDTNGTIDVFVYDRVARTTKRESVGSGGGQANGGSGNSSLSAEGRYLVFSSSATNLVPGVTTPAGGSADSHIYVRDRVLDVTTLVDRTVAGGVDAYPSSSPGMSDDGRYVAFQSTSPNLVADDTNGCQDVFVRDVSAGTTERVSVSTGDEACRFSSNSQPSMTADGRYIAFTSYAHPVDRPTEWALAVLLRDRIAQTTTLETFGGHPLLSGDGRFLTFYAPLGASQGDYVRDRTTGQVTGPLRVYPTATTSHTSRTTPYVTYVSHALFPDGSADEAFLFDPIGQTTTPIAPGVYVSSLSGVEGNAVALSSKVALVPAPTNEVYDIYVAAAVDSHAPGSPRDLAASVAGTELTLTWDPPSTGDAPVSYVIVAGSQPGRTDDAILSTGSTATRFSATVPPSSAFYIRVHATNAAGTSPPSNEIAAIIGSGLRPPMDLAAAVDGSTVTLTWSVQLGDLSPTGYVIEAGSSTGASNLASISWPGGFRRSYVATGVPAGTYFVRLRATNRSGTSLPSNEVMIVVG